MNADEFWSNIKKNPFGPLFDICERKLLSGTQAEKSEQVGSAAVRLASAQRVQDGESGHTPAQNLKDVCANRHGGNLESRAAFKSIRHGLSASQERILEAIRQSEGGLTCDELAVMFNATPNEISGRCSELKRDGKVYKVGTRLTRSGNPAAVLRETNA